MNYLELYRNGTLKQRVTGLKKHLNPCTLCPHACRVVRGEGERGVCGAGQELAIAGYGPHFGEEAPLVRHGGSGTIFFAFCNLHCVFCQNYPISRGKDKYTITVEELSRIMLKLQAQGCVNINLVTPTHYVPQIVEALEIACGLGLRLPLVYNSSGYESLETLRLLDGIIAIYMPDLKYADAETALKYSRIRDYPRIAQAALKEMQRQVGDLTLDPKGVAKHGLLIRHLVMPENLAGTAKLMSFIAQEISPTSWVNIMPQYYPIYRAHKYPEINRRITAQEFKDARKIGRRASAKFHLLP